MSMKIKIITCVYEVCRVTYVFMFICIYIYIYIYIYILRWSARGQHVRTVSLLDS
jgi:hypothetical protein